MVEGYIFSCYYYYYSSQRTLQTVHGATRFSFGDHGFVFSSRPVVQHRPTYATIDRVACQSGLATLLLLNQI